jgi:ferrochelatase
MSQVSATHQGKGRCGVLMVNLGTPDAPTPSAIRRYLRPFLSDRRVVELPRALWLPVLYGFILPFRPYRLAQAYAKVWSEEGSPLLAISRRQQRALQQRLGPDIPTALAMRYGAPGIADAIAELEQQEVRRLLVLPLYPQYSGTTTASVFDAVFAEVGTRRWPPELRQINGYHDDPAHVDALASSIEAHWRSSGRGDHLLMSFHSIPRQCVLNGDPYYCFCQKTARLLAERLRLAEGSWSIAFQSRLGRQPWLQPYTDRVLPQLAERGVKTLDVICPGFAADCLETLEEVAIRYAADFRAAGGETLRYVAALNDAPAHIEALASLVERHLQGWSTAPESAEDSRIRLARVEARSADLYSETLLPP